MKWILNVSCKFKNPLRAALVLPVGLRGAAVRALRHHAPAWLSGHCLSRPGAPACQRMGHGDLPSAAWTISRLLVNPPHVNNLPRAFPDRAGSGSSIRRIGICS
jgi:hypothetical protein